MSLTRALAALALALTASSASGCVYAPFDLGLGDLGKMQEVKLVDGSPDSKILLLKIDGEIDDSASGGGLFGPTEGTTAQVKDVLELSRYDESVKALLVRIDSPGGGVTASDVIYHEILEWKRETGKPVVAVLMDTAASGGFYAAMAADKVIAHPTSIVGSIGVIALLPNVSGLAEKLGVSVVAVKSGERKDMGSPFRPMTPEDKAAFQGLIDQMYARFVDVVVTGRRGLLTRDAVKKAADGRVYTAAEAKSMKLVDEIGYFQDAVAATKKLANVTDARVVSYERKGLGAGRRTIYSSSQAEPIQASALGRGAEGDRNVIKIDAAGVVPSASPRLKYLWLPGVR